MAVAVNMPRQRSQAEIDAQDPLSTILKGLQVAGAVYGIKEAGDKSDLLKQQMALEQKKSDQMDAQANSQSTISQKDLLAHGKDYTFSTDPTPNSMKLLVDNGEDGPTTMYATPRPKEMDAATMGLKAQLQQARLNQLTAKRIPGNEAMLFGQGESASKALGALNTMIDNAPMSGPWAGRTADVMSDLGQMGDGGKSAAGIKSLRDSTALEVAAYLKGGSPTDEEIKTIRDHALPQISDTADVRKQKTENLQMLIDARRGSQQQSLGQAGYDVANFPPPAAHTLSTAGAKSVSISPEEARQELAKRKGISSILSNKPGRN